jgi:SAM-dependent methyltransferase
VNADSGIGLARGALRCPSCAREVELDSNDAPATCGCGTVLGVESGLVAYSSRPGLRGIPEVAARDGEADGYLQHAKFPIQRFRVKQFLAGLPDWLKKRPVIELGCGPGPHTRSLLEADYDVIAVDFSEKSLLINRDANLDYAGRVCYVKADLNALKMSPDCTNLLLMCDFLQHLGSADVRAAFIRKAFDWLAPGGYFYLTFFNLNVVNYLKGDLRGTFAGGAIHYERLLYKEVVKAFPQSVCVGSVVPLNIFHDVVPDRLAAMLPGAKWLSRMIAISGRKAPRAIDSTING